LSDIRQVPTSHPKRSGSSCPGDSEIEVLELVTLLELVGLFVLGPMIWVRFAARYARSRVLLPTLALLIDLT
jgi:hypothetical protein